MGVHPARRRRLRPGRRRWPRSAACGSRWRRASGDRSTGMWARRSTPVGPRTAATGGYRRYAWTRDRRDCCASGSAARPPRAGWTSSSRPRRQPVGLVRLTRTPTARASSLGSHLDSVPGRRRLRRPARRRVGLRRPLDAAAAAGCRSGRPARRSPASPTRRAPGSASPAPARGCSPARSTPTAPAALTDDDGDDAWPRRWRRPAHDPAALGRDDETLRRIGAFVELHVEQGRGLVDAGPRRSAWPRAIWPHGRWRLRPAGRGQPRRHHPAGRPATTRCSPSPPRCWPPARAAERHGALATVGKVAVEPNGVNAIPSRGHRLAGRPRRRRGRRPRRSVARGRRGAPGTAPVRGVVDRRRSTFDAGLRDRLAALLGAAAARCCRPAPGTTPASSPRPASRPRCCSSATRPGSRTPRPSTPSAADCLAGVERAGPRARGRWRDDRSGAEHAWLPGDGSAGGASSGCASSWTAAGSPPVDADGEPGARRPTGWPGWSLPGFANAHSHAFHRALRGRTHDRRRHVLDLAGADVRGRRPARPGQLPRAGPRRPTPRWRWPASPASASSTTCTTPPAARRYADPNAMGEALIAGRGRGRHPAHPARHLLPRRRPRGTATCRSTTSSGGSATATPTPGPPGSAAAARSGRARAGRRRRPLGARRAGRRSWPRSPLGRRTARPLHVHLSEQPAENEACLAAYGRTPDRGCSPTHGVLGPAHHRRARHPPDRRRHRAARRHARTGVCFCPTTERDLADGIGPAARLARRRRRPLTLGSDSHAVIDLFEEARGAGARRAAAHRRARPLHGRPSCSRAATGRRPRARWAGRTPAGIAPGALRRPGRPSGSTRSADRRLGPAPRPRVFAAARRRRAHRRRRRPGRSSATARHRARPTSARCCAEAIAAAAGRTA